MSKRVISDFILTITMPQASPLRRRRLHSWRDQNRALQGVSCKRERPKDGQACRQAHLGSILGCIPDAVFSGVVGGGGALPRRSSTPTHLSIRSEVPEPAESRPSPKPNQP